MGFTVIEAVLAPLLQLYPVPPLAVSVAVCPEHIVAEAGVILAVGLVPTVTMADADAEQLPLVTVT